MNPFPHRQSHRRLALSLLLSAAVILVSLSFIDLEFEVTFKPAGDPVLDVQLTEPDEVVIELPAAVVELPAEPEPKAEDAKTTTPEVEPREQVIEDAFANARPATDWYAELRRVARDESINSVPKQHMGDFDERLHVAALRYYPSPDNGPAPIWENTEIDQIGRTLLWYGECYRVINDPNVMNLWVYETFTQHIVFCQWPHNVTRELPWVREVVARYDYLREGREVYAN